jgi:hypothetical protein
MGGMGGFGGGGGGYGGAMGGVRGGVDASKGIHDLTFSYGTQYAATVQPTPESAPALAAPEPSPATPLPQPDHYLIKTATIAIETEDAQESAKQLTASVVAAGGYVSDLHQQTDGMGRHNVMVQVRVPADKLDGTMEALDALGKVLDRQVSTQDVSEEYIDTDARIRNLKKTEERLIEHLSQAILIDSTLKIEQEMTRVREQLERLEGRQRFLNNRIQYSTITISLCEEPKVGPLTPVNTFSSGRVFSDAAQSLVAFARRMWTKAIWLAVWSPVWGVAALVGWLVYRRVRKAINK